MSPAEKNLNPKSSFVHNSRKSTAPGASMLSSSLRVLGATLFSFSSRSSTSGSSICQENTAWLSDLGLPLEIYRALEIEKGSEVNLGKAGVHWTWVENSADAYFGGTSLWAKGPKPKNPELVVLKAVVSNPGDIDIEQTLFNNMQNPDENEITLKPGANIKLVGIARSGLSINRPLAEQPAAPGSAMVRFPDPNSLPAEAIISKGQGGIPTDPRTGLRMKRVPVFVHPELIPHLDAVLSGGAPKNAFLRGALKVSSGAKSLLLSLSPFHWITVMDRMLEANPTVGGMKSILRNGKRAITMPTPVDLLQPDGQAEVRPRLWRCGGEHPSGSHGLHRRGQRAGSRLTCREAPAWTRQVQPLD